MIGFTLRQLMVLPLFLVIVSASSYIHITSPFEATYGTVVVSSAGHGVPNYLQSENIGSIAPGQTLKLIIDRQSGMTFLWDNIEATIPPGWEETVSKQVSTIEYDIKVPKEATTGTYSVTLLVSGDMQVLSPNSIILTMDVSNALFSIKADPFYAVYIDTSNSVPFSITSDSIAKETLKIAVDGIPSSWINSKDVVLSPREERRMFFTIEPKTEGLYPIAFKATNEAGTDLVSADSTMVVYPASLKAKLTVLSEGFSIVNIVLQPLYSLLSLIGSVF